MSQLQRATRCTDSNDANTSASQGQQMETPQTTHPISLLDYSLLPDLIETRFGLLDELRGCGVLNQQQIERIQSETTSTGQAFAVLTEVDKMAPEKHDNFLIALDKTQQSHVTSYIRNDGMRPTSNDDAWPIYKDSPWHAIHTGWSKLTELIDTRCGLLDDLLSVQCINNRQRQFINNKSIDADSNATLLAIIERKSLKDFRKFISCLRKTKQHHVVALLEPDSSSNSKPVCEQHLATLTTNHSLLIEIINLKYSGLLAKLLSTDGVTMRQAEFIESGRTKSESNARLLDVIKRGSQSDFEKLIDSLIETGQRHVVDVMLCNGAVAEIVTKTNLNVADENVIIEQFFSLFQATSPELREKLQCKVNQLSDELKDCQLIAMQTKHSIKLFILCKSSTGFSNLNDLYRSQRLKIIFQQLYASLLDNAQLVTVHSVVWDTFNYSSCLYRMSNSTGLPSPHSQGYKSLNVSGKSCTCPLFVGEFPHELIELLLMKATGRLFFVTRQMKSRADVHTLKLLYSVCRYWWVTLTCRQKNRHVLRQYFKHICAPFKFNPKLLTSLYVQGQCTSIAAVAELNNQLYIASVWSNAIQVLSIVGSSYCEVGESIKVTEMTDPQDMVACVTKNCLYVSDYDIRCIWRVNLAPEIKDVTVTKFIITEYKPWTLSIQSNRLLATGFYGRSLYAFSCDDDRELIRSSDDSADYRPPENMLAQHAVETSDCTVIVCLDKTWVDDTDPEHRPGVSELSRDGKVLRVLKGGQQQLFRPTYVTMDSSKKHILVCDQRNKQIVISNRELQIELVLVAERDRQPWRLCYSEERGLLYVSYYRSSRVNVYRVSDGSKAMQT